MVETVMDEYEIKQLNDYAMTKWVNEMQIRNSAVEHRTLGGRNQCQVVKLTTKASRDSLRSP